MTSRTIKISEENYRRLLNIAADLQKIRKEKVSFDDALQVMEAENTGKRKGKLSDLAGAWADISDKEWAKMEEAMKRGWQWKTQSV